MKNLILVFVVLSTLTFTSCTNVLDKKYSKESFKEDMAELMKEYKSDSLVQNTLMGMAMADAINITVSLEGKTYREIIDEARKKDEEQRRKVAEERALAEKARKEEEARLAKLRDALIVTVFEKGFYEQDYQSYITLQFVFENKTEKEIRAFTGQVAFTDLFDKEIKVIDLTYDEAIAAKSSRKWYAQTDYNQFIDADKLLARKDLTDMKVVWNPVKILFTDGSSME